MIQSNKHLFEHTELDPVKTYKPVDSIDTNDRPQIRSHISLLPRLIQVKYEKMKRSGNSFFKLPNIVTNNGISTVKKKPVPPKISEFDKSFSYLPDINNDYETSQKLSAFHWRYILFF